MKYQQHGKIVNVYQVELNNEHTRNENVQMRLFQNMLEVRCYEHHEYFYNIFLGLRNDTFLEVEVNFDDKNMMVDEDDKNNNS